MASVAKKKNNNKPTKPAKKAAPAKPVAKAKATPPRPAAKPVKTIKPGLAALKFSRPSLTSQLSGGAGEKLPPRVQAMLDKAEIAEAAVKFARALDRVDETLLRSVLHHDATLDLGPGVFQGSGSDYVTWVLGVLQGVKSSHHMIGSTRAELDGDAAAVETYFQAHFRIEKPTGREDVFMGGRYLDRFERRPAGPAGAWKIAHRKKILDWVRTEAVSDIFYHQNPDALWSSRTKTDPSYQAAQFPGSQTQGKLPAFLGRRYESKSMKF